MTQAIKPYTLKQCDDMLEYNWEFMHRPVIVTEEYGAYGKPKYVEKCHEITLSFNIYTPLLIFNIDKYGSIDEPIKAVCAKLEKEFDIDMTDVFFKYKDRWFLQMALFYERINPDFKNLLEASYMKIYGFYLLKSLRSYRMKKDLTRMDQLSETVKNAFFQKSFFSTNTCNVGLVKCNEYFLWTIGEVSDLPEYIKNTDPEEVKKTLAFFIHNENIIGKNFSKTDYARLVQYLTTGVDSPITWQVYNSATNRTYIREFSIQKLCDNFHKCHHNIETRLCKNITFTTSKDFSLFTKKFKYVRTDSSINHQ